MIIDPEREKLWIETRKVLVEHGYMKQNGEAVEGYEKFCKAFRHLILVKQ